MSVQRHRMTEILTELRRRGCFTVVGGPWVTVQEVYFGDLADVILIGEPEETWPRFLDDWRDGCHNTRYEQSEKTDMTRVPVPRFDLLTMKHYAFGSLQFSRGCPFQCEFCDIIVTFGRRPRLKSSAQIVAELEAIRRTGQRVVFIVDDNLIGNKKAIKAVLREVIAWQQRNGYPLSFFTEASIDLADDPELMGLMAEADFLVVFVGIESPDEDSLREAKKFQNFRQGGTLLEKVHRIQDAGLEVWCGMILDFDGDDLGIFDRQVQFIQRARIPFAMTGLLHAIPKTPLYERIRAEDRLDPNDHPKFITSIRPLLMTPEELRDGYLRVLNELFDVENYFARTEALFLRPDFEIGYDKARPEYWRRRPLRYAWAQAMPILLAIGVFFRLMTRIESPELRREYRRRLRRFLKVRRRPVLALLYLFHLVMHYHLHTMARTMAAGEKRLVTTF
jgi:radical SAM superfamily enzyme YgiQ (UPF0313 family)